MKMIRESDIFFYTFHKMIISLLWMFRSDKLIFSKKTRLHYKPPGLMMISLWWRHNAHGSVSNHQPTIVYSTVYSDAHQRKHQSSASLAFVWGIHRDRLIPRTNAKLRGKCFHLMTSSCLCDFSALRTPNFLLFCLFSGILWAFGNPPKSYCIAFWSKL